MDPVIIAVMSGKGGVGKTTTCLGVGLALRALEIPVGILDLDLENPSLGTACGLGRNDLRFGSSHIIPPRWQDIPIMSLSLLPFDDFADTPTMVDESRKHEMIWQMYQETDWGDSQCLIVDCPPGSGEEVRGLLKINPRAAVVVTAPQGISEMAVRRLINMANEYAIDILGLVQNNINNLPGRGRRQSKDEQPDWAGQRLAERYHLPVLAEVAWSPKILEGLETHQPFDTGAFRKVARTIKDRYLKEFVSAEQSIYPSDPVEEILRDRSPAGQRDGHQPEGSGTDTGGGAAVGAGEDFEAQSAGGPIPT